MPNKKISQLTALTGVNMAANDLVAIADVSVPETKSMTAQEFMSGQLSKVDATNTAGGTTGNRTINKPAGTVNIAAAGATVTVTNSLVTAASLVFATVRTNDTTAIIKNVVPGAGSFVITMNAAVTAETSIGFLVIN